jgi:perosamine synthetase
MEAICTIASAAGLKVIEDAAQSFGVNYKGKHTGIWGDIGVFSFFADKTITMGEGALVVTKNPDFYDRLKLLRNQGRPNSGTFIHPELGMNFRITDLQAAVGVGQLGRLPDIMKQRQRTYNLYREQLAGFADINIHEPSNGSEYVPFRLALTSRNKKNIDEILDQHDVASRSFFYPMHRQPKLVDKPRHKEMSVSEELYETGVCLPIHSNITDLNVSYICNLVKKSFAAVEL